MCKNKAQPLFFKEAVQFIASETVTYIYIYMITIIYLLHVSVATWFKTQALNPSATTTLQVAQPVGAASVAVAVAVGLAKFLVGELAARPAVRPRVAHEVDLEPVPRHFVPATNSRHRRRRSRPRIVPRRCPPPPATEESLPRTCPSPTCFDAAEALARCSDDIASGLSGQEAAQYSSVGLVAFAAGQLCCRRRRPATVQVGRPALQDQSPARLRKRRQ